MKKFYFGTLSDGSKSSVYVIKTKKITLSASDYGCSIISIVYKDKNGKSTDIVLGLPTFASYTESWGSFGAIIGRYSNKINGASFNLDGKKYDLVENFNGTTLHGGFPRWEHILWKGCFVREKNRIGVKFVHTFEDGFQGFPGNLDVEIKYLIENESTVVFSYKAITDKPTPISITNHSYFNLSGYGDIRENLLRLNCKKVLECDENNIPTGRMVDVKGTVYDFLEYKKVGECFSDKFLGYDDCFVTENYNDNSGIPEKNDALNLVAELVDKKANKKLTVFSNAEGMQLYTAAYIKYVHGKNGAIYMPSCAVCFEMQNFPDSPNKIQFPSTILLPGKEYNSITKFVVSEI